ncbi:MAG: alpha-amylase/4-alpha-glucanotransferase domain-containing protein [Promethearchaeota archaeon]
MPQKSSIYFPIIWHAHQPAGNFPYIIEEAYQKSYLPLLQTISKYPAIKSSLHISGSLLMWIQENHPRYLEQIATLYSRKQIEIIGGGFFEPILAIIPDRDKEKQIQLMFDWWVQNYNIVPQGIWLAERVWVPNLPPILVKMGVNFTFIDDNLFRMAGYSEKQTFYAYVTEDQGKTLTVFPINERIRYLVPWKNPTETIKYLMKGRDEYHEKIIVMISDMEKMGVWPAGDRTTHEICYVKGYNGIPWMHEFFEAISANSWIKPTLISDYLKKHNPRGLLYLPTSSYDKMATWSLPTPLRKRLENLQKKITQKEIESELAKDILTFTSGSIWQNFLVKYSQANIMHKRMLICRKKIEETEADLPHLPSEKFEKIWKELLSSQSNDVYWHGLFGGIYYRFLRHSTHKHLIQAEFLLDKLREEEGLKEFSGKIIDVLLDGQPDGILENKKVSCYISSLIGGSIFSLNLKECGYNFLNVLTRQKESYHTKKMHSVHDRFEKWSFQDHFVPIMISEDSFKEDHYLDLGDFANNRYEISQDTEWSMILKRQGEIKFEGKLIHTKISKKYQLRSNTLQIAYNIDFSEAIKPQTLFFSPEINLIGASFPYKTTGIINDLPFDLANSCTFTNCKTIEIRDLNEQECVSIVVNFDIACDGVVFPLYSIPKSEIGFEEIYQGTSIFPKIKISGKKLECEIELILKSINKDNEMNTF